MGKLLPMIIAAGSVTLSCRKSREPIEPQNPQPASAELEKASPTNEDIDEESLLNELEISLEELEKAKEDAQKAIEKEEAFLPKYYTFTFKHSNRCLEVASNSVNPQANIQQGECNGGAHQKFHLMPTDMEDYYFLRNLNSGLCITLSRPNNTNGTNIFQFDCINSDIQRFIMIDQGDGFVIARNKFSQKCFDNTLSNFFTPNNIIQWICHGKDNQKLRMTEVALP